MFFNIASCLYHIWGVAWSNHVEPSSSEIPESCVAQKVLLPSLGDACRCRKQRDVSLLWVLLDLIGMSWLCVFISFKVTMYGVRCPPKAAGHKDDTVHHRVAISLYFDHYYHALHVAVLPPVSALINSSAQKQTVCALSPGFQEAILHWKQARRRLSWETRMQN